MQGRFVVFERAVTRQGSSQHRRLDSGQRESLADFVPGACLAQEALEEKEFFGKKRREFRVCGQSISKSADCLAANFTLCAGQRNVRMVGTHLSLEPGLCTSFRHFLMKSGKRWADRYSRQEDTIAFEKIKSLKLDGNGGRLNGSKPGRNEIASFGTGVAQEEQDEVPRIRKSPAPSACLCDGGLQRGCELSTNFRTQRDSNEEPHTRRVYGRRSARFKSGPLRSGRSPGKGERHLQPARIGAKICA